MKSVAMLLTQIWLKVAQKNRLQFIKSIFPYYLLHKFSILGEFGYILKNLKVYV
jgi:hypothetical protein